jgi:hypothetical protein
MANLDAALQKALPLSDRLALQLRVEAFNLFNHAQFFGPATVNGNITSPGFGQIIAANPPRVVQIALKVEF